MEDAIQSLRRLSFFKDQSLELVTELAKKLTPVELKADEVLFYLGDKGDALYIVDSGQIKVYVNNEQGEEVILNLFGPGDNFAEMALVDGRPRSATAAAVDDTKLLRLGQLDFLEAMDHYPEFALDIIRDISLKLRFAATYIKNATTWTQHIAQGDYHRVKQEIESTRSTLADDAASSDESQANAFLSSFFQMIEGVQKREENLKRELQHLRIQINEAKVSSQVEDITSSDFFQELQKKGRSLRRRQNKDSNS
ncbi:MAG TPA: cyclic nucleotide-binding domain-containing protein [Anaerolineae bacterium]|nr:cyclic nucleotide-binding domain-containing protein [Anaerolineae bacterium]